MPRSVLVAVLLLASCRDASVLLCDGKPAPTWYADDDGDGRGDPARAQAACERPAGHVATADDNCPAAANPDQADADTDGVGDICPDRLSECGDLVEGNAALRWSAHSSDDAATTLSAPEAPLRGRRALRAQTASGFDFWLRYAAPAPLDVRAQAQARLGVRGLNTTMWGWQGNQPSLVLEDADGKRRTLRPATNRLSSDGVEWTMLRVPLAGGDGWVADGEADLARVAAIEVHADTWGSGFVLDVDALSFEGADTACPAECPLGCSGRGTCQAEIASCLCDLGAAGRGCERCDEGFRDQGGRCVLERDGDFDEWPNAVSRANSDPWLAVHHQDVKRLRPKVLALNYVNPSEPAKVEALLRSIIAAMAEGSKVQGWKDAAAQPQLQYELLRVADLRDGADGRPAAPAGYAYENSTLFPRGGRDIDYSTFFGAEFARWYGFENPQKPGEYLPLCELVDRGELHELWIVVSGEKPDSAAYEALEAKARRTLAGNRIPGSVDRCAGNGCYAPEVPVCARSLRIGSVNYKRGPGCFLESEGHSFEHAALGGALPALREWFAPFGNFVLDTKYGLPLGDWYALGCASPPCLSYPTATSVRAVYQSRVWTVDPYDAVCGNVHFPPNGRQDYDISNAQVVQSSCAGFGRHEGADGADALADVSRTSWSRYAQAANDCDGPFLVWWFQNMPGHGSGQTYADGRPMLSAWPFLFY